MARITIGIGVLLILLGVGFYFGTGRASVTALIPAFVGLPVAVLGAIALKGTTKVVMITMHIAVVLTLLGALAGLGRGIMSLAKAGLSAPVVAQLIMGALCTLHVVLSVRSFIAARKARSAAGEGAGEG